MLETIREYGREQLAIAGETERTQHRHAAYYLDFAENAAEHLQGADQLEWLHQLDCESANLRAALAWQSGSDAVDSLLEDKLRVTGKLFRYWHLRGRYTEAITWLNQLLVQPGADAPTRGRAWALSASAALKASAGDNTTVYAQANEGLAIARRLDDEETLANALHILGTLDVALSPPDALLQEESVKHLVEAVQVRRARNDAAGTALSLTYIGFRLLRNGDYTGALSYFNEGLKLGQHLHDHWTTGMALLGMAEATYLLGDVVAAQTLARRSLEHHQTLGDQHGSGHVLGLLGDLAQATGDLPAAKQYYDKSIYTLQTMGEAPRNVRTLWAVSLLAAAVSAATSAVQLAAAAVALSQTALVLPYAADDERLAPVWALAEHALTRAERTAAWAAGQTMTLEQALEVAAGVRVSLS
jgi:tetratricopeptide (TPR) repeat protein